MIGYTSDSGNVSITSSTIGHARTINVKPGTLLSFGMTFGSGDAFFVTINGDEYRFDETNSLVTGKGLMMEIPTDATEIAIYYWPD